ncbi:MAG: histidine utilization repressor [Alphaproteobacteria bacterium]|nr:MAG: histidine utilization repressor [Alphaproteobacteria bacterium]
MKQSMAAPLYQKIKNFIMGQIESGEVKPHEKILSEHQLVKMFGISRMTVNRALRELTDEGYLVRLAGVGTFVAEPKAQSHLLEVNDISQEIRARGHYYSSEVLTQDKTLAAKDILSHLALPEGSVVFHCHILHFEQYMPIQLEDRYVNPMVFPDFGDVDLTRLTPHEYLMGAAPLQRAEHVVSAITPDKAVSDALKLQAHEPCLLLERRTWVKDRVATYTRLYHPGSRYRLKDQFTPA